jgi:probable phosphoglycerate mutase
MSSIDLYLCRHGRTPLNAAGRLRGRLDPDLDLVGQSEARDLAELLSPVNPVRVVSSPLNRARQTATPIAVAGGLGVEFDGRLIDRSYGEFDGALREDLIAQYGSINAAPGLEPEAEVAERGVAALTDLAKSGASGPVVVVTHDAVLRYALGALVPGYAPNELLPPRTGSWALLRYTDGAWELIQADSKDDPIETALAQR